MAVRTHGAAEVARFGEQLPARESVSVRMPILRALAFLLVLAVFPAGAAAAPGRSLGRVAAPLIGDGTHWVGWQSGHDVVTLDAATGETTTFARPAGCDFADLGGGELLFSCPGATPAEAALPVLVHIADGTLHLPAAVETLLALGDLSDGPTSVFRVGRHGLAGSAYSFDGGYTFSFGWRTGSFVSGPRADQVVDLDDARLVRPLCAPLGHKRDDVTDYERPWLVKARAHRILLAHCARRAQETIRCAGLCRDAVLGDRILTWTDERGGHARDLRSGRRWTFKGSTAVAHAGRDVVLARRLPGAARLLRLPG
jgi:hypothetical protein